MSGLGFRIHGNHNVNGGLIRGWLGDTRLHRWAFGDYEREEPGARLGRAKRRWRPVSLG